MFISVIKNYNMKKQQGVRALSPSILAKARRGTLSQFGKETCLESGLKTA
jgi:hypothetical protein